MEIFGQNLGKKDQEIKRNKGKSFGSSRRKINKSAIETKLLYL